jgi:hypothetical protein
VKFLVVLVSLIGVMWSAFAQGSGAPSALGQSSTPQAASAAERAVEPRHERVAARSQARAAKRAKAAASAQGQ